MVTSKRIISHVRSIPNSQSQAEVIADGNVQFGVDHKLICSKSWSIGIGVITKFNPSPGYPDPEEVNKILEKLKIKVHTLT